MIKKTRIFSLYIFMLLFPHNMFGETIIKKDLVPNKDYDIIIIGGGTAAYSAAHTANELNKKTLLVNAGLPIGGTCINIGCIPTKHFVMIANNIRKASTTPFLGIKLKMPKIDLKTIIEEKRKLVSKLRENRYLTPLLKMKNITYIKGWASFKDKQTILVNNKEYKSKYFLIATGCVTKTPIIDGLKSCEYLTITSACDFTKNPKSITILGGGYLGLELAMVYSQFGIKVRIIERSNQLFKSQTPDIAEEIEKSLKLNNIEILKNYHIYKMEKKNSKTYIYATYKGKKTIISEKGKIILATGIKGNTKVLHLENVGVQTGRKNLIKVNNKMQTSCPNIYAAGDCALTPAFACIADKEAQLAILNMFLFNTHTIDYSYLPWVAFTYPQVAGVGINEIEALEKEIPYEVSKVNLSELPKALISNETIGFIKLIRNPKTDLLIGGFVIGPEAGELASFISFLIKHKIKTKDIINGLFPYLTLAEGIKNAALSFNDRDQKLKCCIP